ncbi:MAG: molybdate ABC transporter permease subunit [Capsulimonadales bacterium]|nr:molybdate ABC transporter permease subunit [Capsulimonadales bacterium]
MDTLRMALPLSLKVTALAMAIVVPVGLWAGWQLARSGRFFGRSLVETLLALPLALPPTVVGYGLLLLFGRGTPFGRWLQDVLHVSLLFTWQGAAIAAAIMALPLFVRSAEAAFSFVDRDLMECARTLGADEGAILFRVLIPLAWQGLLSGAMLAFARALGEFGATLMVAGSIPGETETLPLALYAAVQAGDDRTALLMAGTLMGVAYAATAFSLRRSERSDRGIELRMR